MTWLKNHCKQIVAVSIYQMLDKIKMTISEFLYTAKLKTALNCNQWRPQN